MFRDNFGLFIVAVVVAVDIKIVTNVIVTIITIIDDFKGSGKINCVVALVIFNVDVIFGVVFI